ncbi:MAG: hypothetical protein ACI91O_000782 [Candidatus Poriferisodalaceae bacterium]
MSKRRPVRVDQRFLEQLDAQLGSERGPDGEPSRLDFLRFELPAIEDDFAVRFEQLAEVIPGRPDYRQIITAGRLVSGIAIVGQLGSDGSVLLLGVELDLGQKW